MNFPQPIPVKELAKRAGATIIGDDSLEALGINEIHQVRKGDITFVDVPKYFNKALQSAATIILLNAKTKCPPGKALLLCDDPFKVYNDLVLSYRPYRPLTAVISESAQIHPSTIIEPNTIIGPDVVIGRNCHIHANVTISEYTIIGDNVVIQPGTVIGTEAFYYKRGPNGYEKWRSGGRVIIEDNVDIGPGCTINKGVSGDTIIGMGTKLDSQVHIGHDVVIGKHCLLAGQTGVGGNTVIGDWVVLYGQVGVAQNLHIGNNAVVSAKAGVSKDLEGGKLYFGVPAADARTAYRELAALRHLPDFLANFYK
ncbi:MAG: UDP-3-O-(3-hydroxymyristoyl)glucosamine N-acyltransferase [Saprospiraceae bacterium]|nr:UDP-3-O-(3-hydroxymyristoyl)glucosamine N-acyltransferase [Saprospiraceae bacterium]